MDETAPRPNAARYFVLPKRAALLIYGHVSRIPWQPGEPVVIEAPRLVLRSLTALDITPRLLAWHSDPAVTEHLWLPPLPTAQYFRALLEARDERRCFALGIEHRTSGRLVGYVKLVRSPSEATLSGTLVVGDRAFWGAKFGLETMQATARFAFEHLPIEAIELHVYATNTVLIARLRKRGFVEARTYDEPPPSGDGAARRVHVFRQTRGEWLRSAPRVDEELARAADVKVPWEPGVPVSLETRRLLVRSLSERDITARSTAWLTDHAIADNVWLPSMTAEAFFRGLIRASDQKSRFAFALVHKASSTLIGYAKLSIEADALVPTAALGERAFWNGELGTEAARAIQHFGFSHFPSSAIESRVYSENTKVRERLLRSGYEETGVYDEPGQGNGRARQVYVYRITRDAWYARWDATEARLSALPDTFEAS